MGGEPTRLEKPKTTHDDAQRSAPRTVVQKKLQVGSADDPLEHEADRIAQLVVGMAQGPEADLGGESRIRARGVARSMRSDDGATGLDTTRVRRRCEGEPVTSAPVPVGRVQRAAVVGPDGGALDPDSERLLQSARRGDGKALDARLQRRIGGVLGADVSRVRLHEGAVARDLNDRISAKAFTVGNDVFFRDGVPDSGSSSGLGLLAHEVTHTVQQGASPVSRRFAADRDRSEAGATDEAADTAEPVDDVESEGAEIESAEVELSGTIPDIVEAVAPEDVAGLGNREEDGRARAPARRDARASSSAATRTVPVDLGVSVGTSSAMRRRAGTPDDADKLVGGTIGATGQVTGPIPTTDAFGAMTTNISISGVSWKLVKGKISVDLTIDGLYEWEVYGGGNIDVSQPDSPVVTADNYQEISEDLTPKMEGKCWRPPRAQYWSQALTERHEKYHASDADGWVKKKGPGVVKSYLKKNPITLTDEERKDQAIVGRKVAAVVADARAEVVEGRRYYFRKNITDYLKYPGEIRAFGDGKAPYARLAKGIKAHGKKLAKAEADKAKANKAKAKADGASAEATGDGAATQDKASA